MRFFWTYFTESLALIQRRDQPRAAMHYKIDPIGWAHVWKYKREWPSCERIGSRARYLPEGSRV